MTMSFGEITLASSSATGSSENRIFNNTVYGNRGPGIAIGQSGTENQRQRGPQQHPDRKPRPEPVADHSKTTVYDHNMIDGNPLFRDPKANDFHLQPGSPAIDAGVTIAGSPQRPRRHFAAPGQGLRSRGLRVQRRRLRAHDQHLLQRIPCRADVSARDDRIHDQGEKVA